MENPTVKSSVSSDLCIEAPPRSLKVAEGHIQGYEPSVVPKRILILDDHSAISGLLRSFLHKSAEGFEIMGECTSAGAALEICANSPPDLLIMDLSLGDQAPVRFVERIKAAHRQVKILVFSRWIHSALIKTLTCAGVDGIVFKSDSLQTLQQAITAICSGGLYFSPSANAWEKPEKGERRALTEREQSALCLIAEGQSTKEMACSMNISTKTAEKYRERIMGKLGLHDAVQLTHFAIRNGLVVP